jgi:hypothetical protein
LLFKKIALRQLLKKNASRIILFIYIKLPVTMCAENVADTLYWNPMVPELTVADFAASYAFYVDVIG